MENAIKAGKSVGVIEAGSGIFFIGVLADEVSFEANLGQTDADDDDPDEAFADEVDAFAEDTSEESESDEGFGGLGLEEEEEVIALLFGHAGGLGCEMDLRIELAEAGPDGFEVLVGRKVNEVIAGSGFCELSDGVADLVAAGFALFKVGLDFIGDQDAEILGWEGGGQLDDGIGGLTAEQLLEVWDR